jgi:predicted Zn-ribbon and HTH transcriptional regulator
MRSTTCKGSNGQYLMEYHSLIAATHAAEETKKTYGHALTPSKCRVCGYWHLSATSTRRQCMFCTDSGLFLKDIYSTREEAQSIAEHLRREKKILLSPYKCPHGGGWHLTKKK